MPSPRIAAKGSLAQRTSRNRNIVRSQVPPQPDHTEQISEAPVSAFVDEDLAQRMVSPKFKPIPSNKPVSKQMLKSMPVSTVF